MSISTIPADWPAPDNVVGGTTLRGGGVSGAEFASLNLADHVGDNAASVAENRRRFQIEYSLPAAPVWLRQVHGTRVARGDKAPSLPEADGIVTAQADVVCAVLTADCLPVLLTTSDGSAVAAAHAGWRGLSAGILERTVSAMNVGPERILAWLGPAIAQPAFEVGDEVREQFVGRSEAAGACFSGNSRGRWQADLVGLATLRLRECGVTQIFGGDCCTHDDAKRFFSYRRDGRCGRMATFIFRRDES
jgi:purine-nucleoside/S-methyl-5'-thioadenosine phosphorylase / adenosine deaminase